MRCTECQFKAKSQVFSYITSQTKRNKLEVRRGGTAQAAVDVTSVDVRIIAATNQNLEGMIDKGHFRRDLYYRLRGVTLNLPALRDRTEDGGREKSKQERERERERERKR